MGRVIRAEPITAMAFAKFGKLLEQPALGAREDYAADIVNRRPSARINFALIRAEPKAPATAITRLERHPLSTQTFIPLGNADYLVIVCPSNARGDPDLGSLRAFKCGGHQAVHYAMGVWHAGMSTVDTVGIFAMLIHEDGTDTDCQFIEVEPFAITFDAR